MSIGGNGSETMNGDVAADDAVESSDETKFARIEAIGEVEVSDHHAGIHTGVGAPGPGDGNRLPDDGCESIFERALDRDGSRLALPSVEWGAPVAEIHEPAHCGLLLEVCVSEEARAVGADEVATFFGGDSSGFHGCGYPALEIADEFLGVVLNVVENLVDSLAFDNLIDLVVVFVNADVDGV